MDAIENPGYVPYKDLQRLAKVTEHIKQRTVQLLRLRLGDRVLDVGCGPGTDTISMAALVGEDGAVHGVDYDEIMVKKANDHAEMARVAAWTKHEVADALSLPFDSNSFDACRSERLFQHVTDAPRVLAEMVRVTKSGGRIAAADTDWSTLSVDTPEIDIERRIARFCADYLCNGYAGRQLYGLFHRLSLSNITVEIHPIVCTDYKSFRATSFSFNDLERQLVQSGTVSSHELGCFLRSLEEAQNAGHFFAMGNIVLAFGEKP